MAKVLVKIQIEDKLFSTEIEEYLYEILLDGSCLRNRAMEWYLFRVIKEYGSLTEENIGRFIDEKWIL